MNSCVEVLGRLRKDGKRLWWMMSRGRNGCKAASLRQDFICLLSSTLTPGSALMKKWMVGASLSTAGDLESAMNLCCRQVNPFSSMNYCHPCLTHWKIAQKTLAVRANRTSQLVLTLGRPQFESVFTWLHHGTHFACPLCAVRFRG